MATGNIDLTSIPSRVYENVHKARPIPDLERRKLRYLKTLHDYQITDSSEMFNKWLLEDNALLLSELDRFIDESLDSNEELFKKRKSTFVNVATLILGMQTSDHEAIFRLMQDHIQEKPVEIEVVRIRPGLTHKQKHLIQTDLELVNDKKNILVFIEQSEAIDSGLLDFIISALYDSLKLVDDRRVMAMFCSSGSWNKVGNMLPIAMNRLGRVYNIVKEPDENIDKNIRRLLFCEDVTCKPDPETLRMLDLIYAERDPSITNMKYMFQHCITEHYSNIITLATLRRRKELALLLKSKSGLLEALRNLESIKDPLKPLYLDWSDHSAVVDFCVDSIKNLKAYHKFICTQISYYFIMLRDEERQNFPSDLLDLYEELFKYDELSHSPRMFDALSKLISYKREGLLRRIKLCIDSYSEPPERMKDNEDVHSILETFREKLENNDNYKETNMKDSFNQENKKDVKKDPIVKELVGALLKHVRTLGNPSRLPLSEVVYFNFNISTILKSTMPATRLDVRESSLRGQKANNYFNILFSLVYESPEEINMSDLYQDFIQAVEETNENSEQSNEGLLKAIFIENIDSMVFIGLLRYDTRNSKKGTLKKCMWL